MGKDSGITCGVAVIVLVVNPLDASLGVEGFLFTLAGDLVRYKSFVPLGKGQMFDWYQLGARSYATKLSSFLLRKSLLLHLYS